MSLSSRDMCLWVPSPQLGFPWEEGDMERPEEESSVSEPPTAASELCNQKNVNIMGVHKLGL